MTKKRITGKKAQVGTTLTWIAAFLIIFFIMLLFLAASISAIKLKKLTKYDYSVSLEATEEESAMQSRMLVSLMNSHITIRYDNAEKEATIKNSLELLSLSEIGQEGIKKQIENNLLELAKYEQPKCYLFRISSEKGEMMEHSSKFILMKSNLYGKADSIYVQGKEGQIEIKLFAGRC